MESEIAQIQKQLDRIVDNELIHIKDTIADLTNRISDQAIETSEIRTDVKWLKTYHWTTMTAAVGAFVAAVIGIIIK